MSKRIHIISQIDAEAQYGISEAAGILKINRSTLYRYFKKYSWFGYVLSWDGKRRQIKGYVLIMLVRQAYPFKQGLTNKKI